MEHSKLLINETPLIVLPTLVMRLGFEKAVILQQIQYLVTNPQNGTVLEDGNRYIWNTAQSFTDHFFPFWKPGTVAKHLRCLEKKGYLISTQPRSSDWDRTKFYRINYALLGDDDAPSMVYDDTPSMTDADADSMSDADTLSLKETKTSSETSTKKKETNCNGTPSVIAMTPYPVPRPDADPLLWNEWLEMRRKRKTPLTQRGYDNLVRGLRRLIAFDINERLEQAIDRRWLGLIFENDKTGDNNGQYKSTADKRADTAFNTERVIQQLQSQVFGDDTSDHLRLT